MAVERFENFLQNNFGFVPTHRRAGVRSPKLVTWTVTPETHLI